MRYILWEIKEFSSNSDLVHVKSFSESDQDATFHTEAMCLKEGWFLFAIFDLDGICCEEEQGHCNVTSNGVIIVQGGYFTEKVATTFSHPFIISPSAVPSFSQMPSSSTLTTLRP